MFSHKNRPSSCMKCCQKTDGFKIIVRAVTKCILMGFHKSAPRKFMLEEFSSNFISLQRSSKAALCEVT